MSEPHEYMRDDLGRIFNIDEFLGLSKFYYLPETENYRKILVLILAKNPANTPIVKTRDVHGNVYQAKVTTQTEASDAETLTMDLRNMMDCDD